MLAAAAVRNHKWGLLGGLAVACLALGWLTRAMLGPEVVCYPVIRGDLVRTVVASGHVETPFRVEVGSQITGTVAEVLVNEGQAVTRGQPLITLDASELQAAVVQAEGLVQQAEAQLRQMEELSLPSAQENLKQAKATLVNAKEAYDRASRLAASGYGTHAALDAATRDLDVARTQVRSAELAVFTMSPGGSNFVIAQTQLTQARATLATANARLGYATVAAPRDGVLISRKVERGAVVQPGKALFVLAPSGNVQLVVPIDEKNLGLLSLGQDAKASADAYPDKTFPAKLTYINPGVDISRASVEVKLTSVDPPPYLRQDMTVSVDIEVDRRKDALIAPTRVIHDPTSGRPWVLIFRNGRASVQQVHVSLRAGDKVELTDGVNAGDLLIPVAAGVRAGQRLRAVMP
ncbi:efflux RND transporter periplasmic adaptor subunit [Alsobacter metallidurans]|uniref:efflux RND transporter periplasmic adaptor subunit n=1 Tax=Alsobacter metallidurans TaxID=340221 RepID=UPI003530C680